MIRNAVLALGSLLLACGLLECGLRATRAFNAHVSWTEPDPLIGFRSRPGRTTWSIAENDHVVAGRINSMGWRDREHAREKPAGTTRVAVLGDSYVEALQVEMDSTCVAVAERIANRRSDGRYEFMNFGRSGMGPAEEYAVLVRDVLPRRPDVVVLVFTPTNDVADASPATALHQRRPFLVVDERDSLSLDTSFRSSVGYRVREFVNPLKQRSALVSLVSWRYNAWRARAQVPRAPEKPTRLTPTQSLLTARPDSTHHAGYALAKRGVMEMARVCKARGVAFVLAAVPLVYEQDEIATLRAIDPTFDAGFFDRDLGAMADTSGSMVFVPLTEAFRRRYRATGKPLRWAHWNYAGHRLVGEVLAAAVAGLPEGR